MTALAKYKEDDASAVDAREVLKMATIGGAKAMNLKDCDVLDIGKQADLIMIDLQQPNMRPLHNLEKNLVYSGSKQNIKMTMIAGKILYENSEFILEQLLRKYMRRQKRLPWNLTSFVKGSKGRCDCRTP